MASQSMELVVVQQVVVDHRQVLQVVEVGKVKILVVHVVHVVGQRFHHLQEVHILLVVDQGFQHQVVVVQKVLLQVQPLVLGSLVTWKVVAVVVDLQEVVVLQGERFKSISSGVVGGVHGTCSCGWG